MMNAEFQKSGYVIVKNFLDRKVCDFLTQYFWLLKVTGMTGRDADDDDEANANAVYGDCAFESLMASSHGFFSDLLGVKLYSTFSYARLYYTGVELKAHLDRPACEYSVTLTLGGEFEKIWPIYIESAGGESIACHLDVGDALVYKGCERKHWREPFEGVWQAQVFMFYVDANGPYAEWKFDKRPFLGPGVRNGARASQQG
jgi:hypothetical protein